VSAAARPFRPGVYHPGGDRKRSKLALAAGQQAAGIDIQLRAGGVEITGVVSDLTGGPIEKARVKALPYVDLCIKDAQAQSRR